MTCRKCGHEFCWHDMQNYRGGHFYNRSFFPCVAGGMMRQVSDRSVRCMMACRRYVPIYLFYLLTMTLGGGCALQRSCFWIPLFLVVFCIMLPIICLIYCLTWPCFTYKYQKRASDQIYEYRRALGLPVRKTCGGWCVRYSNFDD